MFSRINLVRLISSTTETKLKETIKQDLKSALKSNKSIVPCIKSLLNDINQVEKHNSNETIISLIQKGIKKRQESVDQFIKAGRSELADNERMEIHHFQSYLPRQLSNIELDDVIERAILKVVKEKEAELNLKDLGRVIKEVGTLISPGSVDMKIVASRVKELALKVKE